jgi:protein O-GlcNAc transferase
VFAPRMDSPEHLARHRLADLFLDTLPYNAHTTSSDALWAGLPVLTCIGRAFPGRVAASILRAVGLSDLITNNLEEYAEKAFELATHPEQLREVRDRLAHNRTRYPLFDTTRFCRNLESAYTTMLQRYESGLAPETFAVASSFVMET